jgi:glycosyltransferase involved in cell wall biosynthesis
MNIVIDIRPLMDGKHSGIQVYLVNLIRELLLLDGQNTYILFANAAWDLGSVLPSFKGKNITVIQTRIPNKILNLGLSFLRRPKLDRLIIRHLKEHPEQVPETMDHEKIDVFFMPDLRPCALSKETKKITVIHDLSFRHFKKFFSAKSRLWYKLMKPKREIQTSDLVIAVSNYTKNDIAETYKIPKEKISVVHEGVAGDFYRPVYEKKMDHVVRRYNLPEKYFLFLSTLEPRKNIENLIKGFIQFKNKHPDNPAKLVIAGSENHKIFSKVNRRPHPEIIFTGFIDEEDKAVIIKHAECFVYPSFFEGFGLPLLEAMKCETPIITSNTSSMPEIAGGAALFINPDFPDSIAGALEKIQEPALKNLLKQKMRQQVVQFTWTKCALETLNLIKAVVDSK